MKRRDPDWTIAYHRQIFDDYGRPAGMSPWVSFYNTQGFSSREEALQALEKGGNRRVEEGVVCFGCVCRMTDAAG